MGLNLKYLLILGILVMDNNKMKHLEFLQNIITRMNSNSFQIKTFTITIVSALLVVFASNKNEFFIAISIFAVLLFWFLDSYYLQQERKFRGIYNNISGLQNDMVIKDFEMPIHKFIGGQFNYWKVFFSITILLFYGIIIVILAGVLVLLHWDSIKECIL